MSDSSKRRRRMRRRGSAVVEMALILPVLLIVVFGALQIGQLIYFRKSLVVASYEGARLASRRETAAADVQSYVASILEARRMTGATVTVTPDELVGLAPGTMVTVQVSASYLGVGEHYLSLPIPTTVSSQACILRE